MALKLNSNKMKRVLFSLFLIMLFTGCNDDDGIAAALIGNWVSEREEIIECNEPTDNDQINRRCTDASCFRLIMNADGTFTYQRGTFVESGTYSRGGSSLSLCVDEEGEEVCEVYVIDENTSVTLVLSTNDEITGCKNSLFFERQTEEVTDDES